MKKIAVHLATGFEEIEAVTIIDVLRRAGYKVFIISMTNEHLVKGSHQIPVQADQLFSELDYEDVDMIVLPGGTAGAENLDRHEGLKSRILKFNERQKPLAAICAGPMVFGHLNLLKGKKAVCYPGFENELYGATIENKPAVIDGNFVTGKGVGAALKFALKIVELFEDKGKAEKLAKAMVMDSWE